MMEQIVSVDLCKTKLQKQSNKNKQVLVMDIRKTCEVTFPRISPRFRITSASKERTLRPHSLRISTVWSKKKLPITQNLKNRSNSLKSSTQRIATMDDRYQKKTVQVDKEQIIISEPNQAKSPRCKRIQKNNNFNSQIGHKQNMRRIQTINRVFGPKKRVENNKSIQTASQSGNKRDRKQYRDFIKGKQQGKISPYIFETRKKKFSLSKQNNIRTTKRVIVLESSQ